MEKRYVFETGEMQTFFTNFWIEDQKFESDK